MLPTTVMPLQHDLCGWILRIEIDGCEQDVSVVDNQRIRRTQEDVLAHTSGRSRNGFSATENGLRRLYPSPIPLGIAPGGRSSSTHTLSINLVILHVAELCGSSYRVEASRDATSCCDRFCCCCRSADLLTLLVGQQAQARARGP